MITLRKTKRTFNTRELELIARWSKYYETHGNIPPSVLKALKVHYRIREKHLMPRNLPAAYTKVVGSVR